ncbi:SRPBCC family protein [Arthrobacter sp. TMS2-4]
MSGLFSHPSAEPGVPEGRPDLRFSESVPAPADHAWAGLTQHLHLWWPADELSRWGADSFFDLEDNALVETSAHDDENVWGEVTDSHPGDWLQMSWRHVGSSAATVVRIEMTAGRASVPSDGAHRDPGEGAPGMTLTLIHGGWTASDPQDVYDFYRGFWPGALSRYRRFMGGS